MIGTLHRRSRRYRGYRQGERDDNGTYKNPPSVALTRRLSRPPSELEQAANETVLERRSELECSQQLRGGR